MQRQNNSPREPLGIGSIFQLSFSHLLGHMPKFMGMAFVFQLISFAVTTMITGMPKQRVTPSEGADVLLQNMTSDPKQMVAFGISMIISALAIAYLTMAAFDVRNGEAIKPANYLTHGIKHLGSVAVTILLIMAMIFMPAVLAISMTATSPGLSGLLSIFSMVWTFFVVSTFSVVTPAILMEERGLSAMARSAQLTAGYRLSITLLYAALGFGSLLFMTLFSGLTGFLLAGFLAQDGVMTPGFSIAGIVINLIMVSVVVAFASIVFVNLYGRLIELSGDSS